MNIDDLMAELERLGSEQTRKTYKRHGSGDNVFGVSFAHLGMLKKRIKTDHALARQLWATGNSDARTLATMIADPAQSTLAEAEAWLKGITFPTLIDLCSRDVVSKSAYAREAVERWCASRDEFIGRAGWVLLGQLAAGESSFPDDYFAGRIQEIEATIHGVKNRTRETMNQALIRIGGRSPALRELALAAAVRIGKVEVDHGDTACKTSDAVETIEKIWARNPKGTNGAASTTATSSGGRTRRDEGRATTSGGTRGKVVGSSAAAKKATGTKSAAGTKTVPGAKKAASAKKVAGAKKAASAKKAAVRADGPRRT
ncbi:DNA alkylation repair protein [Chondromyces crocatus]|uniref:DNA alkylation repair protein n=1 Tax=Chondromyces crocatus TaxID=52 RepID=A0A0K1EPZ5_CHOCO|nr:DNA alkylation repair protein [Chondromyces crocatus]AKT42921.1 uncharacterized protein CMC5_071490 [Chondromyces crocatus]